MTRVEPSQTSSADMASFTVQLKAHHLVVLQLEGHEGISSLPHFTLRLLQATQYAGYEFLTPSQQLGQSLLLTMHGKNTSRSVSGIIQRFDLLSFSPQGVEYEVELVSCFAKLQLNTNCRIFQQCSTPELVAQVLGEYGLSMRLRWLLAEQYPARDYCVQYQESDWDFIARLLEEEGIFFYLATDPATLEEVLLCGDGPHAYAELDDVCYRPEAPSHLLYEEALRRFEGEACLRPTAVTMRDYRFKSPGVRMDAQAQGDEALGGGTLSFYPGEYQTLSLGNRLSRARMGEAQTGGIGCRGEGNFRAFSPGGVFLLLQHPVPWLARPWLVTRLHHRGAQSQALQASNLGLVVQTLEYQVTLEGIPHDQRFVPPRLTPRPLIRGLQSAVVVGPAGETIYTDAWGRVKVKFHWDRLHPADETASCWIRVSQGWAGQQYGVFFLPRIGQEVLIHFIEGDPDRPVIIGRVYNDYQQVPYKLPDNKTISTLKTHTVGGSGYNELRFEDLHQREEIWVHGQRDWNIVIEELKEERIGHDKRLRVGQDHQISIGKSKTETVGMHEQSSIGMNRTQQVGRHEQRTIAGNRLQQIGVDDNLSVSGKHLSEIGGHEQLRVENAHEVSIKKSSLLKTLTGPLTLSTQDHLGFHAKTYIKLTCGEASLLLKADGSIYLIGKKVELKAGTQLNLKSGMIMLNPPSLTTPLEEAVQGPGGSEELANTETQATAPAPAPSKSAAPGGSQGSNPIADVQSYLEQSPTMQEMWKEASSEGWTVQYGTPGGGSYADRGTMTITIDGNQAGNPAAVTETLAHELGHATYEMPPMPTCAGKTQAEYSAAATQVSLMDEGNATLANATVQQELAEKGLNIGVAGSKSQDYQKIAKDKSKTDEAKCGEIADLFGKYEKTSNTQQNYATYYGNFYNKVYASGRC